MLTLTPTYCSSPLKPLKKFQIRVSANGFPSFLPQQTDNIKDSFARNLARRIERLPVQLTSSGTSIMSSCVRPMVQEMSDPIVLLHGFDSSCLEWRYTYPLLEDAGLESWAFDILGWGFSDLERLPQCDVASKRNHLYQFWKSYIKRPMILVGPSLGAAVAIDFAVNHPEAVSKLILIDASVYSEGTGEMANLPRLVAYAGVALLKSVPLRLYVNRIAFNDVSFSTSLDWMNIGRLHCLYPWWEDATVSFMSSGGYNVVPLIKQVKQQTLIIWGEDDQIISYKLAVVSSSESCIMSSCIRPTSQGKTNPIVLLHGFDSSCLEWRSMYPLLEEAGAESWAIDILGWGFSNLERLPSCDVASKRDHMYQFWKSYIKRPMILVGPSLGAAIAIDFAVNHPEAVSKLVLIDASVYAEGIGGMAQLPCIIAKTGLELLKSIPLRLFVNKLVFKNLSFSTSFDWMSIGRLHCLLPWWRDATLDFIASGGYNVTSLINQVRHRTLIIWGEDDQIIRYMLAHRLYSELQNAILRPIPDCGHIPHVEKPSTVANLILKFVQDE